jgi:hypothetical protein
VDLKHDWAPRAAVWIRWATTGKSRRSGASTRAPDGPRIALPSSGLRIINYTRRTSTLTPPPRATPGLIGDPGGFTEPDPNIHGQYPTGVVGRSEVMTDVAVGIKGSIAITA